MAALLVVALILAGVFWFTGKATLFGDPEPPPAPSPAGETLPTPVPVQRLDQVREDLNRSLDAAQERRQQVQDQMNQP